ncbi:MAG: hypothetical protein NC131_19000 [Roseburia sp.]|nr:hypothetical protein [Roseburia sp.]
MKKTLYYYVTLDKLLDIVVNDYLDVTWENSYEHHYFNGLVEDNTAWGESEFCIEFTRDFADVWNLGKSGGLWYSQEPINAVVPYVKDIRTRGGSFSVTMSGFLLLTEYGTRISSLYQLSQIILRERLVVSELFMWEAFSDFCDRNTGKLFGNKVTLLFSNNGYKFKEGTGGKS